MTSDSDSLPKACPALAGKPDKAYRNRTIASTLLAAHDELGYLPDEAIEEVAAYDGSLRYLCLLAVLCHPDPPPVVYTRSVCTRTSAKLLVEAPSSQIFVTTHRLVDALTAPEAIVCEKSDTVCYADSTRRNSDPGSRTYWTRGRFGGNRW